MTSGWGFPTKWFAVKELLLHYMYRGTNNIILNRFHWPCRTISILRRATFRKFKSRDLDLDRVSESRLYRRERLDLYPHIKFHHHCSFNGNGRYNLLIWSNSLISVSRDRAHETKSNISLRPGEGPKDSDMETSIRFRWSVGAYGSGVGPYFSNCGPFTFTLILTVRKTFIVVHQSSTFFTHTPSFIMIERKIVDGRTDIESGFISFRRWPNNWVKYIFSMDVSFNGLSSLPFR